MPQPTIIAVGELLVEFVSHCEGCNLRALSEYSGPYPSGAPAICIDQASRVGAASQIYGAVGEDNFGSALIDRLESNAVNTSGITRVAHKSTGVAFVSYFGDGTRTFVFRYYWAVPAVRESLEKLFGNLNRVNVTETLASQYFSARAFGDLQASATELVEDHIALCIHRYYSACGLTVCQPVESLPT